MHKAVEVYCREIKRLFPHHFFAMKVLDVGSLDINGTCRPFFHVCDYTGIDLGEGSGVDVVCMCHKYNVSANHFDTIVSVNTFEHDKYYVKSLKNICRILKHDGLFFFSCTSGDHHEHGTVKNNPNDSPFTSEINGWKDYYKNLFESDIRNAIDIDKIFKKYEFNTARGGKDLQFWGIKK